MGYDSYEFALHIKCKIKAFLEQSKVAQMFKGR